MSGLVDRVADGGLVQADVPRDLSYRAVSRPEQFDDVTGEIRGEGWSRMLFWLFMLDILSGIVAHFSEVRQIGERTDYSDARVF